jgi:hypothetical protein
VKVLPVFPACSDTLSLGFQKHMRLLAAAATVALIVFSPAGLSAGPEFHKLFDGHGLDGWEVIGDGLWGVTSDGILIGQRDLHNSHEQSWLYSKRNFDEFDLRAVYWLRFNGNSGISIRDGSRARFAVPPDYDPKKTPSHIGYEIQLENHAGDPFHTGSVYLFDHAKEGALKENDWNQIDIQVRHAGIQVMLNGQTVSQSAGDPARPLVGPIGLQLHDRDTVILFRSIEIREIGSRN